MIKVARVLPAVAAAGLVTALSACSAPTPTGTGSSSEPAAASSSVSAYTVGPLTQIPGQLRPDTASAPSDHPAGSCASIADNGTITVAACDSDAAVYRVNQRASTPADCAADSDRIWHAGTATLCLDINWLVDQCVLTDAAGKTARNIACDSNAPGRLVRPTGRQLPDKKCLGQSYTYPYRKFTICVAMRDQ